MADDSSPVPGGGGSSNKGKKGRRKGPKTMKPKMTKEERRAKFTAIARNRRDANMSRKRDKHLICYRCRKSGHSAENCKNVADGGEGTNSNDTQQKKKQGGNICYKCGSTEHRIQLCPKIKPFLPPGGGGGNKFRIDFGKIGELPFANCYICNQSGHLSSHCPESKRGLYPQGGSCRECGSVDHFAIDCPEKTKKKMKQKDDNDDESANEVTIDQYLEEPVAVEEKVKKAKKKRKVVNF